MESVRAAMKTRHLEAGQWLNRKECLGSGRRRQLSQQRKNRRVVAAHYKKKDNLLNCWTTSSDISGYQADFHEGHYTVGAWQGRDRRVK